MILGPYRDYASTMPWWSLPLSETAIVDALSAFYQTSGIPHLVLIDKNGSVLHNDAVNLVMNRSVTEFPWRPKRFVDLLPRHYVHVNNSNQPLPASTGLDQKHYLLIYAGSHTCPPCQKLAPKIAQVYQQLKAQRDDFEVRNFFLKTWVDGLPPFLRTCLSLDFGTIQTKRSSCISVQTGINPTLMLVWLHWDAVAFHTRNDRQPRILLPCMIFSVCRLCSCSDRCRTMRRVTDPSSIVMYEICFGKMTIQPTWLPTFPFVRGLMGI